MKRRDFIKKGGVLSAGILASTSVIGAVSHKIGANDTINIGVIGTGSRGGGLIPILNTLDGINITACCDVLPFRLEEGIKKAGNQAKAYRDYRELLDDKSIDAVLIATPFNTHSSIAIDAIDMDKHVYCEKTMAKGLKGIDTLVQKADGLVSLGLYKGNMFFQSLTECPASIYNEEDSSM
ncbi:MAG: Gfo/Idh/MocA family oxidoreductase, partial [Candidatus Heimdallarchaeota archaeon]|nr:Gfo/Idh/MocA family oxidoreductase [Candidatus Heimdallarchaeota archaeon]